MKKDINHKKAVRIFEAIKHEELFTNSTVLIEVFNALNDKNTPMYLNDFLDYFINLEEIYFLNENDYKDSLDIFNQYGYSINYADCTIVHSMIKHKINKIVSFDSDFEKINGLIRISL